MDTNNPTQPASSPEVQATPTQSPIDHQNRTVLFLAIGFVVLLVLLSGTSYYVGKKQNSTVPTATPVAQAFPSPTQIHNVIASPEPLPSEVQKVYGICSSKNIGVSLKLPTGWTCDSSDNNFLSIKYDIFDITISNMGRGPVCEPVNENDSCTTSPFLINEKVNLEVWTSLGEVKEIFGGIVPLNTKERLAEGVGGMTYISIQYSNMDKQMLSDSQKQQLIDVLNTIMILPTLSPTTYVSSEGWTMYTGTTAYGNTFKLKYPNDWSVLDGGKATIVHPASYSEMDIYSDKTPYIMLGMGGSGGYDGSNAVEKTYPAGKASYTWSESGGMAIFEKNNASYIFNAVYRPNSQNISNEKFEKIFNTLLSTLSL